MVIKTRKTTNEQFIEKILGRKFVRPDLCYYLVKWVVSIIIRSLYSIRYSQDKPDVENTWEPEVNLSCPELIAEFERHLREEAEEVPFSAIFNQILCLGCASASPQEGAKPRRNLGSFLCSWKRLLSDQNERRWLYDCLGRRGRPYVSIITQFCFQILFEVPHAALQASPGNRQGSQTEKIVFASILVF